MIEVGKNPNSPFVAYGDDSQYLNTLAYAYAVFDRNGVSKAEKKIGLIKRKFKIPDEIPIHCRVLFSGHQREKNGLGHLNKAKVRQLVAMIIDRMNQVPCLVRYAVCTLPDDGILFPESVELISAETGENSTTVSMHNDPKGILGLLSTACFNQPNPVGNVPYAEDCHILPSIDDTKARLFGDQKRRADSFSSLSVSGSRAGTVRVSPDVSSVEQPLHQLADVYSYICSHAYSDRCEDPFFRAQLKNIKYFVRNIYHPDA